MNQRLAIVQVLSIRVYGKVSGILYMILLLALGLSQPSTTKYVLLLM